MVSFLGEDIPSLGTEGCIAFWREEEDREPRSCGPGTSVMWQVEKVLESVKLVTNLLWLLLVIISVYGS